MSLIQPEPKLSIKWRLQSATLDELLNTCDLRSSFSSASKTRVRRLEMVAGNQNWRCCYCGVRMFAGHPREDIFLYAQSMGISLYLRGGEFDPTSFEAIRGLRATVEHLLGIQVSKSTGIAAACQWCNGRRQDRSPTLWAKLVYAMMKNGKHPHSRFIHNKSS